MFRGLAFFVSMAAVPLFAGNVQLLASLPGGAVSKAIQLDAAGNIYLAGAVTIANPQPPQNTTDAFVAKLSADGSKVIYFTVLSGTMADTANGLALGADGSVYVAGSTGSSDFPVTPGALQTTFNQMGASQGFIAKLNPAGTVVYASFINGTSFTTLTGIALGSAGEVFLTGMGGPDFPVSSGFSAQGYILKLDAALSKVLLSVYGYGGGLITLDGQGNIYIAGNAVPSLNTSPRSGPTFVLPTLPAGAFQSTGAGRFCVVASGPPMGFSSFCPYQLVAKLDATGKLLWGTYVNGSYGATAAGMAVDSAGNVIVAGTTNSSDYPVTPGAFQTAYTPTAPQAPVATFMGQPTFVGPPNAIGYVTKVNATGTALLWSTYFGGSFQDQITGMAVTPSGDILLSGRAGSSDLFFANTPDGCLPTANQVLGFVARLSADGASAAATQPVLGAPDCLYTNCPGLAQYHTGWPLALRPTGTVVVAGSSGTVASLDFSSSSRVACVTDPADNAQLNSVAPGQFISLFGANLAPAAPFIPAGGVAQSTDAFGVFFNGIPAPVLYSSAEQINVQVPYEIAEASTVQMKVISTQITNPVLSETRTLGVVARQPAIFLSPAAFASPIPGWSVCSKGFVFGQAALALNADGSVNDCTNPATAGTTVTVFLGGFGVTTPPLATGAITPGLSPNLTPSLDPGPLTSATVIATQALPGSVTGVARVFVRSDGQPALFVVPNLAGVPLRERVILIWIR